jgi:hypothetical protein
MTVAVLGDVRAAGENPVALGPQALVERTDGRHLIRGGGAGLELQVGSEGLVVDHGNEVLHHGASPVSWAARGGRPLTLLTNAAASIRHRLPDFFKGPGLLPHAMILLGLRSWF